MSLRPNEKKEVRRAGYKAAIDGEASRRRREDNLVNIRKSGREEYLLKRREEPNHELLKQQQDLSLFLSSAVADLCSDDMTRRIEATWQIRNLVSTGSCSPINKVVQAGAVPHLVKFMAQEDIPRLQHDAACAVTNIASGTSENTKAVIDHGAVPVLIKMLNSSSDDVREQAVWALGNIAGDQLCRGSVLHDGALLPLLSQFNENAKPSMLKTATWTLSNFCRAIPQPFEQLKPALPVLRRLIHLDDEEVKIYACWALSYLTAGDSDNIQIVIESDVCPRLVELLHNPSFKLVDPVLRTVGHIVSGNDAQTQFIINLGALPYLLKLLTSDLTRSTKKAICWVISNITAGSREHIQAVIDVGLISPLAVLLHRAEFEIKKEATWAIANASSGANHAQIRFLVSQGCIGPLCDVLACRDLIIVFKSLGAIEDILKAGQAAIALAVSGGVNLFRKMVDDAGGRDEIESLQNHNDNQISEKAVNILKTYWSDEDDELAGDDPMA